MTPLSSAQRNGDLDDVVVTAACDEHPYRPRGKIIEDYDLDVRIGQQSRDPGLPRTTAPRLRNDRGRNCEGETVCCGALQQAADPFVTSLESDQGTGVQRQTTSRWGHVMRPVRRSSRSAHARAAPLGSPSSRSRSASNSANEFSRSTRVRASAT
jgi:hypothetical protein